MEALPNLAASMRYVPEPLISEQSSVINSIVSAYNQVYAVDSIIYKYAYALEVIQPSATGKIAIRFLKRKRVGSGRHPQLIQWYKSRGGRMLYTRLAPQEVIRKVKGYPLFAPVKDDVKILLKEARVIMEHREKVLDAIDNLRRQCAVMDAKSVKFLRVKAEEIQGLIPVLAERRAELMAEWKAGIEEAEAVVPRIGVGADKGDKRVSIIDRTRGTKHETHRGKR